MTVKSIFEKKKNIFTNIFSVDTRDKIAKFLSQDKAQKRGVED